MIPIIIYGDEGEKYLGKIIFKALSNIGNVSYSNKNEISCYNKKFAKHSFCIYDTCFLKNLTCSKGIFIFKNSFSNLNYNIFNQNFIPIFNSQNLQAAKILSTINKTAITCGTSDKNTLCIASVDKNKATISLQRYIKNFYGQTIEPLDFTINLTKEISIPLLLITCSVLILVDEKLPNEYII